MVKIQHLQYPTQVMRLGAAAVNVSPQSAGKLQIVFIQQMKITVTLLTEVIQDAKELYVTGVLLLQYVITFQLQ